MKGSLEMTVTVEAEATLQKAATPRTGTADDGDELLLDVAGRLGKFSILSTLGAGAMGVVYAAYDEHLGRKVAIKLVRANLVSHDSRFVREAQGLARLSHPNVVQIYEIGTVDSRLFIAMEFVAGRTLSDWLDQQPRTRDEILRVFIDAGRGLAAAHAANLVHRDFKPDNVMVGDDGRVRVMDFGLVHEDGDGDGLEISEDSEHDDIVVAERRLDSALNIELTRPGSLLGTPAYMAPEQHLGQATDARADQFSFCIALWEALYGRRPFSGKSWQELIDNVLAHELVEVPRGADVPGWLRAVVERGLVVETAERWDSMDDLLGALDQDPTRRRRWIIGVGLGVTLTVAAVLGNQVRLDRRAEAARAAAQAEEDDRDRRCTFEASAVDEVWNEDVRRRIERAFLATEHSLAADTWERVRVLLDRYADTWAKTRKQVCIDAEVDPARDSQWSTLASICLDGRRAELGALAMVLGEIDGASGVIPAVSGAARLAPLDDCINERVLERSSGLLEHRSILTGVQGVRERLARVKALHAMGKYEAGKAEAEAVLAEAEALGWPPLEADAHYWVGWLEMVLGDQDSAQAHLEDALFIAGEAHDPVALNAASGLVYQAGEMRREYDDALRWGRLGQLLVGQSEAYDGLQQAKLLNSIGTVHARRDAYEDAIAFFGQALEIYEVELPPEHPDIASVLNNLGTVHYYRAADEQAEGQQDDEDTALAFLHRARNIRLESLSPKHPDLAATYYNIARVHELREVHEDASESYLDALTIWEQSFGSDYPVLAFPLAGLGRAHEAMAKPDLAHRELERALELRESGGPGVLVGEELGDTYFALARVSWVQREPEAASKFGQLARETYVEAEKPSKWARVDTWLLGIRPPNAL